MKTNSIRAVLVASCAGALVALSAFGAQAQDQRLIPAALERVGAHVSESDPNTIVVDISRPGAQEALAESDELLDGRTIQIEGIRVLSSDERKQADLSAPGFSADELTLLNEADRNCPPAPSGARTSTGVVPYLGCNPETGPIVGEQSTVDDLDGSLANATAQLIGQWTKLGAHQVNVSQTGAGRFQIDLPASAGDDLSSLGFATGSEIYRSITFMGYSDSRVKQLTFTVNGDCLAFHQAIGGDLCSPFTFFDTAKTDH